MTIMRPLLVLVLCLPAVSEAQDPPALPIGATAAGTLGSGGSPARYRFEATGPGVLTIAAHGGEDLTLAVMDEDGQPVPEGTADRDLNGDTGAEVLSVILSAAGTYLVEVRSNGGSSASSFTVGASWVAMAAFARPPDPDGRPSQARAVTIGTPHADQLHPDSNDLWDWFVVRITQAGTLAVVTRMDDGGDGDLALEVYLGQKFTEPVAQSDQDLQGNMGNESVTVDVKTGDVLHIKVRSLNTRGGAVPYRLTVARVP